MRKYAYIRTFARMQTHTNTHTNSSIAGKVVDGTLEEDESQSLSLNAAMRLGGVRNYGSKSIVPVDQLDEEEAKIQVIRVVAVC